MFPRESSEAWVMGAHLTYFNFCLQWAPFRKGNFLVTSGASRSHYLGGKTIANSTFQMRSPKVQRHLSWNYRKRIKVHFIQVDESPVQSYRPLMHVRDAKLAHTKYIEWRDSKTKSLSFCPLFSDKVFRHCFQTKCCFITWEQISFTYTHTELALPNFKFLHCMLFFFFWIHKKLGFKTLWLQRNPWFLRH